MERIIFIRHGKTDKNSRGIIHAFGDTEFLNEEGVNQIKTTAHRLKEFKPDKIYYSDGERARQSGEIISKELGIPPETLPGIEERNWGDFCGKTWAEVEKILAPMPLEERYNYIPPNGESWKSFEARLIKALNYAISKNSAKRSRFFLMAGRFGRFYLIFCQSHGTRALNTALKSRLSLYLTTKMENFIQ